MNDVLIVLVSVIPWLVVFWIVPPEWSPPTDVSPLPVIVKLPLILVKTIPLAPPLAETLVNETASGVVLLLLVISTAISVNLSMITLQESETMKRLAAYAALIAVPTLIAGIYGMNFAHMPELGWKYGYAGALGLMVAIDTWLFIKLRKSRWL